MDETIKQLEALIDANNKETNRTPFLDVMRGGLITARDNAKWHLDALAKVAKPDPKAAAKA